MSSKEFENYFKKQFDKCWNEKFATFNLSFFVNGEKEKIEKKLKKYQKQLTYYELNMLHTLNNFCLLLDIRESFEINNKIYLEAYNLENKCILRKEILL